LIADRMFASCLQIFVRPIPAIVFAVAAKFVGKDTNNYF
jgi:hypothetical protein